MSDFSKSWEISRSRLLDTISDLNDAQLNWRIHDSVASIGQMAIHVAGVEVLFGSQILGTELDEVGTRIKASATDGVVNDKPFPFADEEITTARVQDALSFAKGLVEQMIISPTKENLEIELVSALGPVITGQGALARLAFHPAYHQGQAYLIRTAPGFPR